MCLPFAALEPSNDPLCVKEKVFTSRERDEDCTNASILVFGALTAIGSWLTLTLRGRGMEVFPVAHSDDTIADELVWYRRDQLIDAGIKIHFADTVTISSHILKSSNTLHIIYITKILENSHISPADNRMMKDELSKFISVLEVFKDAQICSLMLLTRTFDEILPQAWLYSFETTLAVYHKLHNIPTVLIRTGDLYGPWTRQTLHSVSQDSGSNQKGHLHQCWYIADVALIMHTALTLKTHCLVINTEDCNATALSPGDQRDAARGFWDHLDASKLHPLKNSVLSSHMWAKAYITKDTHKDIVMTSYFTTAHDPQWNVSRSPNQFQYIQDWYQSIKLLGMEAVVFHDGLDLGFVNRVLKDYSKLSFVLVPSLYNRSTNDARFYAYQTYLDEHPEISMVMLTDISDVRFQHNPFLLMRLLGDNVYMGADIDVFPGIKYMPWISVKLEACFGRLEAFKYGGLQCLSELDTVYNAGVVGGTRHAVMAVLWWVTHYLNLSPTHLNCNMGAVNIALHKHFYERVFTGFPLVSKFMYKQAAPKAVYIIHK